MAEAFASHHASQCGYCTPGFVVATHAAIQRCASRGVAPTIEALQQGIDGNLCRCTGYRPILDACRVRFLPLLPCLNVARKLMCAYHKVAQRTAMWQKFPPKLHMHMGSGQCCKESFNWFPCMLADPIHSHTSLGCKLRIVEGSPSIL